MRSCRLSSIRPASTTNRVGKVPFIESAIAAPPRQKFSAFRRLLVRALAAAIEPGLELADTDGVFGLGLVDADGQSGRAAKEDRRPLG